MGIPSFFFFCVDDFYSFDTPTHVPQARQALATPKPLLFRTNNGSSTFISLKDMVIVNETKYSFPSKFHDVGMLLYSMRCGALSTCVHLRELLTNQTITVYKGKKISYCRNLKMQLISGGYCANPVMLMLI